MVAPERTPLPGWLEVDETSLTCHTKDGPPASSSGRRHQGKPLIAGAVQVKGHAPGRIRQAQIPDFSARSLHALLGTNLTAGVPAKTEDWAGYPGASDDTHDPHVVRNIAAHALLPGVHRVFSNLKTWAFGVYHGLRPQHLQVYLNELAFRFMLGIGLAIKTATYWMLIEPELKE